MNSGKSFELNIFTSATPSFAMVAISLPKIYINPANINTSAISAVVLSLARFRIRASGRKISSCIKMKYWTGMSRRQFVIAMTNA